MIHRFIPGLIWSTRELNNVESLQSIFSEVKFYDLSLISKPYQQGHQVWQQGTIPGGTFT